MPIKKVEKSSDKYRELALGLRDRNELTGRNLDRAATHRRVKFVVTNIGGLGRTFRHLVDVGCGDGSFLEAMSHMSQGLTGIVPTEVEQSVVSQVVGSSRIQISCGTTDALGLTDAAADLILCNDVLHGAGFSAQTMSDSLREFRRVLDPSGVLYIGELPNYDEFKDRHYGTSFSRYLLWVTGHRGIRRALKELRDWIRAGLGRSTYVIVPPGGYWARHADFTNLCRSHGFQVEMVFDSSSNSPVDSMSEATTTGRFDYLCRVITPRVLHHGE